MELPGAVASALPAAVAAETTEPSLQTQAQPGAASSSPMSQHLYILTGASRGLGLAMARELLQPGNQLLCLSRKTQDELQQQAEAAEVVLEQWLSLIHI